MFSLFFGTHEKIDNTDCERYHVHTVCKKGIPRKTDDQIPFTGNYLQSALMA